MVIPCCVKSLCQDPSSPFENLSAENPDSDVFFGYSSGWYNNPTPIGNTWNSTNCTVQVTSTVSQEDADLKAAQLQIECTIGGNTTGGGGGGGNPCQTNPQGNCVPLFQNSAALCTILCPDGLPFNYVFQAGQVTAPSAAEAQAIAQSLACIVGQDERLCLNSINGACLNQSYTDVIGTDGGTAPFTYQIISGNLPPGITGTQPDDFVFLLDGTPTSAGNFSFTIRVVDRFGVFFVKTYTLAVLGITNSPTQGQEGSSYNFTFSVSGGTAPYTFTQTGGTLPAGLTLSSSGTISGTPTVTESDEFTVQVTDATGNTCSFSETITINNNCNCSLNWQAATGLGNCRVRIQNYVDGLIPSCAGSTPTGAPNWDGTFPIIQILFSEVYKSVDPISIQGKGITGNGITLSFGAGTWTIGITDNAFNNLWTGTLVSPCPIGTYTKQAGGCNVSPATITLEAYSM